MVEQVFDGGKRKIGGQLKECKILFRFDSSGKIQQITTEVPERFDGPVMPVSYEVFRFYKAMMPKERMTQEERYRSHLAAVKRYRERRKKGIRIRSPYRSRKAVV